MIGLAVRDALAAADSLRAAQADLALPASATPDELAVRLSSADDHLERAEARLDRPAPRLVAALPLLGRSWTAERRATATARAVVDGARTVTAAVPELRRDGGLDLLALSHLATALQVDAVRARLAYDELAATPLSGTPPVVAQGVRRAVRALQPAVTGLEGGAAGARVAGSLLGAERPRSVLVALQNNAELRGAGGYVSTVALGTAEGGRIDLEQFLDVEEVLDPLGTQRRVPASDEYQEDFGAFLGDTTYFRTWTMSPHVPDTAAVGAHIVGALRGERPDVVLLLDVPAMVALVGLAGVPVTLPDGEAVPADRLLDALLIDSYAEAGDDASGQQRRRAALQASAARAATAVLGADLDAAALRELGRLARGRHLAVWSSDATEQAALEQLGIAGAVETEGDADLLHVSVNNLSGNKLDTYVERDVEHVVDLQQRPAAVTTTVRLDSTAPPELVPYVAGDVTPGVSSLRIEFSLPTNAVFEALTVDGRTAEGDVRFGAARGRALTYLDLAAGEEVEVQLRYWLPLEGERYALEALPQALAEDAALEIVVDAPEGVVRGPDGDPSADGIVRTGPWGGAERWTVAVEDRSRWERLREAVRSFWTEPVALG